MRANVELTVLSQQQLPHHLCTCLIPCALASPPSLAEALACRSHFPADWLPLLLNWVALLTLTAAGSAGWHASHRATLKLAMNSRDRHREWCLNGRMSEQVHWHCFFARAEHAEVADARVSRLDRRAAT